MKWLMKGVDVEKNKVEIQTENDDFTTNSNDIDANRCNMEALKHLAEKDMEHTVSINTQPPPPPAYMQNNIPPQPNNMRGGFYPQYAGVNQNQQIKVFKIFSQSELQQALAHLSKQQACVVDFEAVSKRKKQALMDYVNGGVFALGATMNKLKGSMYMISPRGMQITVQSKSKNIK